MALTDKKSKGMAIFFVIAFFIIIVILGFVFGGARGILNVVLWILGITFVVAFFGFLFYIIYYIFFKKHRVDVTYENWKSYKNSAKDNGADLMIDLVLIGDKNHSSKKFMTITGYLKIMAFDDEEYDLFVGKRSPSNPFEEDKIVMVKPSQHSDLIGEVYVYGISLIQKYGFYFLNTQMLDFQAIDKTISQDAFRTIMYTTLGDMKGIVDRATGLDPDFNKQRQSEKLLKIPVLQGQEENK